MNAFRKQTYSEARGRETETQTLKDEKQTYRERHKQRNRDRQTERGVETNRDLMGRDRDLVGRERERERET